MVLKSIIQTIAAKQASTPLTSLFFELLCWEVIANQGYSYLDIFIESITLSESNGNVSKLGQPHSSWVYSTVPALEVAVVSSRPCGYFFYLFSRGSFFQSSLSWFFLAYVSFVLVLQVREQPLRLFVVVMLRSCRFVFALLKLKSWHKSGNNISFSVDASAYILDSLLD